MPEPRQTKRTTDFRSALEGAIDDALRSVESGQIVYRDEKHATVELSLKVRVMVDLVKKPAADGDEIGETEAMGPRCCVCVFYQNGSYYCYGTCCPDVVQAVDA